jgi:ATP-dependent Lhr-like helicase
MGWTALRQIQEEAIRAILAAEQRDVIIAAPTAGGKTEAVFLPLLSAVGVDPNKRAGFRVLYIAPLRALIDDQYRRVRELAELVGVEAFRWHSDVPESEKNRAKRAISGVLMTTPESLEAMLVLRGAEAVKLFAPLSDVVVDELHSFMPSERGVQLQSLLRRLEVALGQSARRIALSATLSDLRLAAAFLRPRASGPEPVLIQSQDHAGLQMRLHAFVAEDLDERADPSSRNAQPTPGEPQLQPASELAPLLFRKLRTSKSLIFVNTRQGVEVYADKLRRMCEAIRVPNEFHAHHGSLSPELRGYAESQLRDESRPASVVCTSTLELGLDIGRIESVAQIGAPPSVASIRQRLGRSGRRGGPAVLRCFVVETHPASAKNLEDSLHIELVQTIAQTELLLAGWCESPDRGALHLSTLLHQVLALIGERGGVGASDAWSCLCGQGPFVSVTKDVFIRLLRQMGEQRLIEQSSAGVLMLGPVGERLQSKRDFFAVFFTPVEYTLRSGTKTLGSLPILFPLRVGLHLIFGGQRWAVEQVDELRRIVFLSPSPAGRPPRFHGGGWPVDGHVRRKMHDVYLSHEVPAYLDETAARLLESARRCFGEAGLREKLIVERGGDALLFCWTSDQVRYTLQALMEHLGHRVELWAVALRAHKAAATELTDHLCEARSLDVGATTLATGLSNKLLCKFDGYLSEDLLAEDYASRMLDLPSARAYITTLLMPAPGSATDP